MRTPACADRVAFQLNGGASPQPGSSAGASSPASAADGPGNSGPLMERLGKIPPHWVLAVAVLLTLGPFLAKPFHMDDPLFVWAAQQIQKAPGDPYGFQVNWDSDTALPMSEVTKNPPLAAYYLAAAGALLGWSEPALHLAFLLPALAAILGTHRLARHFCRLPMLAACATLFTPVFLVSSTSVMSDTMLLAFWVWAAALWIEGLERMDFRKLCLAALLIALAALTKYFGLCLLPLLAAYSVIEKRKAGAWFACFLIPALVLGAYVVAMRAAYGQNLLTSAGEYANQTRTWLGLPVAATTLVALAFTGGCVATSVLFAPWLWRWRTLLAIAGIGGLFALAVKGTLLENYRFFRGSPDLLAAQLALWAIGGITVLSLAIADVWEKRDARAWLLALWVVGTFVFAAFINWTINGRTLLPLTPAVAILIVRRLERASPAWPQWKLRVGASMSLSAALALVVAWSDYAGARAAQQTVEAIQDKYGNVPNRKFFFGHWGFQFYMEQAGATALDKNGPPMQRGDLIFVPAHNPTSHSLNPANVTALGQFTVAGPSRITTMNDKAGAGFYGSFWGPLPFVFGEVPPEMAAVGGITR